MTSSNTFFGTTPEAFLERARVARVCKRFWDQPNILMPAKYLECRAKDHPEPSHYETRFPRNSAFSVCGRSVMFLASGTAKTTSMRKSDCDVSFPLHCKRYSRHTIGDDWVFPFVILIPSIKKSCKI